MNKKNGNDIIFNNWLVNIVIQLLKDTKFHFFLSVLIGLHPYNLIIEVITLELKSSFRQHDQHIFSVFCWSFCISSSLESLFRLFAFF